MFGNCLFLSFFFFSCFGVTHFVIDGIGSERREIEFAFFFSMFETKICWEEKLLCTLQICCASFFQVHNLPRYRFQSRCQIYIFTLQLQLYMPFLSPNIAILNRFDNCLIIIEDGDDQGEGKSWRQMEMDSWKLELLYLEPKPLQKLLKKKSGHMNKMSRLLAMNSKQLNNTLLNQALYDFPEDNALESILVQNKLVISKQDVELASKQDVELAVQVCRDWWSLCERCLVRSFMLFNIRLCERLQIWMKSYYLNFRDSLFGRIGEFGKVLPLG